MRPDHTPTQMKSALDSSLEDASNPTCLWIRFYTLIEQKDPRLCQALLDNPGFIPRKNGKYEVFLLSRLARHFPEEVAKHHVFLLLAIIDPVAEMWKVVVEIVERTTDWGLLETLWKIWGVGLDSVRVAIAKNKNLPVHFFQILGHRETEKSWVVRKEVALNPNCPEDILRTLCNPCESHLVRHAVSTHPKATEEILLLLLSNSKTGDNMFIRFGIVSNPATPESVLQLLSQEETEPDSSIRDVAMSRLSRGRSA